MLLESPALSRVPHLVHGFSTRLGGVSRGPYATWNLAGTGDDPAHVRENRRRFAHRLGLAGPEALVQVDQVHSAKVVDADEARGAEADGIVTSRPDLGIGIRTADCVPVLIACLDARGLPEAVAAVHAGWRGAVAGILAVALRRLEDSGARLERAVAAVGPAIGFDAFEVGEEVVQAARDALGEAPRTKLGARGRPHLDLRDLVHRQLLQSGLHEGRVDHVGGCTYENAAMFFSHRRDQGLTGRHLSAIGIRGPR